MPMLEREGAGAAGALYYEVHDLTPPWRESPETIVFHHGVGIDADIWSGWLPHLLDRYRIVRFDTRGFGRSPAPGEGFGWSFELLVDDVLAVARAGGAERFHLVGESLGGTVGMATAIAHPEALHTLTVVSASHKGGSIQRVQAWREFIGREGMGAWSQEMMGLRFREGAIPPEVHAWFDRVQAASSADTTLDLADLLIGADLTPDLPKIATPTLLLAPDSSPFVPPDIPAAIRGLIPDAELQIFAGARHGLACSHARPCAEALRDFLQRRGHG